MIAPVAGSGSWPTWIARVSNSISEGYSRQGDRLELERAGEACGGALEPRGDVAADAGLRHEALDPEDPGSPVGFHVGPAEEAVAGEERQDVVAVRALV